MSAIVACPSCRLDITLPEGAHDRLVCPHCEAEFSMQPVLVEDEAPETAGVDEEMLPPLRFGATQTADETEQPADEGSDDAGEGVAAWDAAPDDEPADDAPAHHEDSPQPASGWDSSGATGRQVRRRRRGPGPLAHLVGIVGGGVIGLYVGYWLLNYLWGPQFYFLEIWLPGVPHASAREAGGDAQPQPDFGAHSTDVAAGNGHTPRAPEVSLPPLVAEPDTPAPISDAAEPAPRGPPQFSGDELGEALAAANAAVGCPRCDSTGYITEIRERKVDTGGRVVTLKKPERVQCPECRGEPSRPITPEVYAALCRLAHVATFADRDDPGVRRRRDGIELVLTRASDSPDKIANLGRQASQWLARADRQTPGVVLVGTVRETTRNGAWHKLRLVLFGSAVPVTVVSRARGPFEPRDRVIVAGSVIDNPSGLLPDYRGDEPQVVQGGPPMRLSGSVR